MCVGLLRTWIHGHVFSIDTRDNYFLGRSAKKYTRVYVVFDKTGNGCFKFLGWLPMSADKDDQDFVFPTTRFLPSIRSSFCRSNTFFRETKMAQSLSSPQDAPASFINKTIRSDSVNQVLTPAIRIDFKMGGGGICLPFIRLCPCEHHFCRCDRAV